MKSQVIKALKIKNNLFKADKCFTHIKLSADKICYQAKMLTFK